MTNILIKVSQTCDAISEWAGKLISWFIGVLILILTYEVISRFLFNRNVPWAMDVSYMLGGSAIIIGAAWALKNRQHVRVDTFYDRFPPKMKAIIDIVFVLLLFFPLIIFGLMNSFDAALLSWQRNEHIMTGNWQPPIYPLKSAIPIAFFLLLIQGISELCKSILQLTGKEE
ncbi:TRAP transporter small permease subunit [Alkalihalobacterium alkalinitrilicum]|uniref:TRAP transporter small permease subunit n=1 Tax=Alkalihalobacterium alkalinitrilicum TaxID=427920 RepID=UPI0013038A7D|nr:TRAP transporter small permease subunit [Alkalihalobacterium alkalinitrilicum]